MEISNSGVNFIKELQGSSLAASVNRNVIAKSPESVQTPALIDSVTISKDFERSDTKQQSFSDSNVPQKLQALSGEKQAVVARQDQLQNEEQTIDRELNQLQRQELEINRKKFQLQHQAIGQSVNLEV